MSRRLGALVMRFRTFARRLIIYEDGMETRWYMTRASARCYITGLERELRHGAELEWRETCIRMPKKGLISELFGWKYYGKGYF